MKKLPLLCVVGPTASGKSALALKLAQDFNGELVNADSRQVYRYMDIGTAKPLQADRDLVPHHLLDLRSPDEGFDLSTYLTLASQAVGEIIGRDKLPIVVGGTGQYIWALLEGWQVPGVSPDTELRLSLQEKAKLEGSAALHCQLAHVDPVAAANIHPHNTRRIIRALEVSLSAGQFRPGKRPPPFQPLVLGLTMERQALYQRIDQRFDQMMDSGLLEETKNLLAMGYSPDLPALSSAGYRQLTMYLQGHLALEKAVSRAKTATHSLGRRQYTWFRLSDPRIRWLDGANVPLAEVEAEVRAFLAQGFPYGTMAS